MLVWNERKGCIVVVVVVVVVVVICSSLVLVFQVVAFGTSLSTSLGTSLGVACRVLLFYWAAVIQSCSMTPSMVIRRAGSGHIIRRTRSSAVSETGGRPTTPVARQ